MTAAHTPHTVLALLGPLHLTIGGRSFEAFRTDKTRALLAYLAVEAGRPHRREALAALLWPDQPDAQALQNLRQALARLRRMTNDDGTLIHITPKTVQFNAAVATVDVRAFEALVRRAEQHQHEPAELCAECAAWRAEAVALYHGDFLTGLALPDSEPFDTWAQTLREQLHRQAVEACAALAAYHESQGAWAEATRYAEQLLVLEPWQEAGYRVLMRLFDQQGRPEAALAQFERCQRVLAEEFGTAPDAATTALRDAIHGRSDVPAPRRSTLPRPLTALRGRAAELAQIAERLAQPSCRLLTLVGPGGVGKTHLALEAASAQQQRFVDGVWLVNLVAVRDPAQVLPAISEALGAQPTGTHHTIDALHLWLRGKQVLLLLDNFEQVLPAAPQVASLVQQHPGLVVLVTSRAPLRVGGEQVLPIDPLALPDIPTLRTRDPVAVLHDFAATALFVERATSASPTFRVTEATAPLVATICARLDGLPLAIELAAARVRLLSVPMLLARLEEGLRLLAGGMRDRPDHQQTMQRTIAWSYHLLDPAAQVLFVRLGVFAGGWTLAAAETVGAPDDAAAESGAVLDSMVQLLDHSLIGQQPGHNGEPRFAMLETIRAYALEQFADSGVAAATQQAHFAYYRALAQEAAPHLWQASQPQWLAHLAEEHHNIHAALHWAYDHGVIEPMLQMATALRLFWLYHGHQHEGRRWLEHGLAAAHQDVAAAVRAHATYAAGLLATWDNDFGGAQTWFEHSLAVFQALHDEANSIYVQYELGNALTLQAQYARAEALLADAVDRARTTDANRYHQAMLRLGTCAALQGQNYQAIALLEPGLAWMRQHGDAQLTALALVFMGMARLHMGAVAVAEGVYREALQLFQAMHGRLFLSFPLLGMAGIAVQRGEPVRAATLLGAIAAHNDALGITLVPALRPWHDHLVKRIRAAAGDDTFARAWTHGQQLAPESVTRYALGET